VDITTKFFQYFLFLLGGLSFSIPSDTAIFVTSELMTNGKVRRGYIGLVGQTTPISPRLARLLELQAPTTVQCISVAEGGPAHKAGLRKGDFIVAVKGSPLQSMDDLYRSVSSLPSGTTVGLSVLRAGGAGPAENINVELGDASTL